MPRGTTPPSAIHAPSAALPPSPVRCQLQQTAPAPESQQQRDVLDAAMRTASAVREAKQAVEVANATNERTRAALREQSRANEALRENETHWQREESMLRSEIDERRKQAGLAWQAANAQR